MAPDKKIPYAGGDDMPVAQQFNSGNWNDPDDRADFIIDATFVFLFLICAVVVLFIATRNFIKYPKLVNKANVVVVFLLGVTLINRMVCLVYSMFFDANSDIDPDSLRSFFYFELPFWYINMATVIHFFEWSQFVMFLSLPTLQQQDSQVTEGNGRQSVSVLGGIDLGEDYQAAKEVMIRKSSVNERHMSDDEEYDDDNIDVATYESDEFTQALEEHHRSRNNSNLGTRKSSSMRRSLRGAQQSSRLATIEDLLRTHKRNAWITLIFLTVVLLSVFGAEYAYNIPDDANDEMWEHTLLRVTKGVMATCYGIVFVAFAPLFGAFVWLLKRHFRAMYDRMKVKLHLSFFAFMSLMGFRFTVYVLIEFVDLPWADVQTVRGEIPLYISEILIAVCYMQFMTGLSHKAEEKENAESPEDPEVSIAYQEQDSVTDLPEIEEVFDNGSANLQLRNGICVNSSADFATTQNQRIRINESGTSRPSLFATTVTNQMNGSVQDGIIDYRKTIGDESTDLIRRSRVESNQAVAGGFSGTQKNSPFKSVKGTQYDDSPENSVKDGRKRKMTQIQTTLLTSLGPVQTDSMRRRTILESPGRKTSQDYEVRAHTRSANHFGKPSQFRQRQSSLASDETVEMVSDGSNDHDDLYRGGTSDTHSHEGADKSNPLRLSGRQLYKPQMSPKSYDSDDQIFSKEQDNFLFRGAKGEGNEGADCYDEEFKLDVNEKSPNSKRLSSGNFTLKSSSSKQGFKSPITTRKQSSFLQRKQPSFIEGSGSSTIQQ